MKLFKNLLFLIVILQGLTVEQFVKIPQLYTHFVEHNEITEISFSQFLFHHYLEFEHDDDDDDRDNSLPFKNAAHSCFQYCDFPSVEFSFTASSEFKKTNEFIYLEDIYSEPVFDIIHPPSNLI